MPILPQGQDPGQALGDLFGGVNRPQLNAFVATSQARNGLVSAQTQDALIKASQAQEQMAARDRIHNDMVSMGAPESDAQLMTDIVGGSSNGDFVTAAKGLAMAKLGYGNPQSQTSGQQMYEGKLAAPVNVPNNFVTPPGSVLGNAPVQQSPQGAAQTAEMSALAGLNTHKDTAPQDFRNPQLGATSPEQQAALTRAVSEGRLDPMRVNSRSAPILAQMELNTPGMNFNGMHADATLQSNAGFQQKAITMDAMPTILSHMTSLGKQLNGGTGYSDVKTVGQMQKWMNGELNDPDYTEYMSVRNDALMKLASVMRGVGMSDQAHTAEVQAAAPTLSPLALDGWLKGQMSTITPLLKRIQGVENMGGGHRAGTTPDASGTPPAPPGPAPLGAAPPTLPAYQSEAQALAAGHKVGDRVIIGGVTGTLQ
jgi:hypothetical protein